MKTKNLVVIDKELINLRLKVLLEFIKIAKRNGGVKELNQLTNRVNDLIVIVNESETLKTEL